MQKPTDSLELSFLRIYIAEPHMLGIWCNSGNIAAESMPAIAPCLSGGYGSEMFKTLLLGQKDIYKKDLKIFCNRSYTDITKFDGAAISFERMINRGIMECEIYVAAIELVAILILTQRKPQENRHVQFFACTSQRPSLNNSKKHSIKGENGNHIKIKNSDIIDHNTCRFGGSESVQEFQADSTCTFNGRTEPEERKCSGNDVESYSLHCKINDRNRNGRKRRKNGCVPTTRHTLQKFQADSVCTKEGIMVRKELASHPTYFGKNEKIHRKRKKLYTKRGILQKGLDCFDKSRPFSMPKPKTKVKLLFVHFLANILMFIASGQAKPINHNLSPVWSTPLLTNQICNNSTLDYSDTCQTDEYLLQLLIQHCNSKCDDGYKVKCVNTLDGVTAYVCLPENLSCKEGIRWTAQINTEKPSEVIMREENCPDGTFQSSTSNCFDACYERHQDTSLIGEKYSLYSHGDNVNPTIVYCNYEKGFYSTKNMMLIDFDRESKFNRFLCQHVGDLNPCSGEMFPLPNGACVLPCLKGQCRDAHDNFICKESCRQGQGEDGIVKLSQDKYNCNNLDTCKNGECNSNGDCECLEGFTYDEEMQQCKEDKRKENAPNRKTVLITCFVVFVVLVLLVVIYFIWKKRKNLRREVKHSRNQSLTSISSADVCRNKDDPESCSLTSTTSADSKERNSKCEHPALRTPAGHEYAKHQNDCMTQQMVSEFNEHMKSVGALMCNGDVAGTVFRAGEDYVLTAYHVIRNIIIGKSNTQGFDISRLEREDVFVNFNSSVGSPPRYLYRVQYVFSSDDPKLDFAVLKIVNPVQLPLKMFLYQSNYQTLHVQELSGIGYGNPENINKKHLDPRCRIIPNITDKINDCETWMMENYNGETHKRYYERALFQNGKSKEIAMNPGYTGIDTSTYIFVDISLQHGGSGSPFLTVDGKVVGILTHGFPEFSFHLPPDMQRLFPKHKRFEGLLRLDLVYESINAREPDLAHALFG